MLRTPYKNMLELFSIPRCAAIDWAILITTFLALALALLIELRTSRVPNALVYPLIAWGLAIATWDERWNLHLIGFCAASLVGIIYYSRGWIPVGIAKLGIAIGLLAGVVPALAALFAVMLVWPLMAWRRQQSRDPNLREQEVHCSPPFVAGALLAMGVLLVF